MDSQPALQDTPRAGREPLTPTLAALSKVKQSLADLQNDVSHLLDASGVIGLVVDP